MQRIPAPVLAVAAIFSLQFGAAFARSHFDAVGPLGAATLRLVFAALILVAVVRPKVRHWTAAQWGAAALLGVALAGMNSLIYLALDQIPLGVAVTLEFTGPLVLALVQTRRWRDALWAIVAFAGVLLLGTAAGSSGGSTGTIVLGGVLLAVAAGLFWAGYIVASSRVGSLIEGMDGLVVAIVVAAVIVAPFGAVRATAALVAEPGLVVVFVIVAVLTSALPYALELVALRTLPTRVFGVLSALGPAVASLAGFAVLHQRLGLREAAALVLVSAASVAITLSKRPPSVGRSAPETEISPV